MNIVVLGAGGIGGYMGARLALAGHSVRFVDSWAEHVAAINRHGLHITGEADFTVQCPASTLPDPTNWPVTDLLILATKNVDTAAALAGVKGLAVRCATTIQNGLGLEAALVELFGPERVVGMVTLTSGSLIGPGQVRGFTNDRATFWGPVKGENVTAPAPTLAILQTALAATSLPLHAVASIEAVRWCKMVWWIPLVLVPAVTRLSWGAAYTQRDAAHLRTAMERECASVANALGHEVRDYPGIQLARRQQMSFDQAVDDVLAQGQQMIADGMADYRVAMLLDLERRRRTEVENTAGVMVRAAHKLGLPVPYTEFAWRAIRAIEGTFND